MLPSITRLALQGFLVLGLSAAAWPAYAAIGTFQFTFGDVKVVNVRGQERVAQKGAPVDEGETVVTGAAASAQLKMVDGGVLAVRPDTQLKFDTYRFPGREDGTERGFMSLVKGGFRTITGAIGRLNKPNYRVTTPTATVGIRGTDHEVIHIPIPAAGQIALGQPGTYDKVNVGAAYIRNPAGTININPNQVGYAPPVPTQPPQLLPKVPDFFRPAPPPAPHKQTQQQKEQAQQAQQKEEQAQQKEQAAQQKEQAPAQQAQQKEEQATQPQQQAAQPSTEAAPAPAPAPVAAPAPEPIRVLTVMDNQSQMTSIATSSAVAAATPAAAPPPVVAQVMAPTATAGTSPAGSPSGAPPAGAITVTLTDSGGVTLDLAQQTVTTSTGETASISEGVSALQREGILAQAAADQAAASVSALNAALAEAGSLAATPLPTVLASASSAVSAAQFAVAGALNLTIDTATAASNAPTLAALAQTAATRASAASTAFAANAQFADPHIAPVAMGQVGAAIAELQTSAAIVQTEANNVAAQAAVLAALQSSASAAAGAMNASISTATNAISALGSLGVSDLTTAQSQLSIAESAALAAQTAATQAQSLQGAGDLAGAQAALASAQQQQGFAANALAVALKVIEGISAAAAAESVAGISSDTAATAFGYANAAQAAVSSASESLAQLDPAASTSAANLLRTKAQIVADNYLKAQYSNPAVESANFRHGALAMKTVTGGVENKIAHEFQPGANTRYVLDENNNLVEIRDTTYVRSGYNYNAQIGTAGATSIQFSGGTPQDHYQAADGTAYMGRWQGGQITVNDNGVASGTDLGNTSAHWLVALTPGDSLFSTALGPINNVQRLIGTSSYSLVASTKPTDSLGNVGTLNSASLTANFTAQTVDAGVNVSFPTRNLILDASAHNVPIDGSGFKAAVESPYAPTVNCTGSGCSTAAPSGYTGEIRGGFTGAASSGATTGAVGTGAGLIYALTPVISGIDFAPPPTPGSTSTSVTNQPFADLIQGAAAFSTATAPSIGTNPNFTDNANLRHRVVYPISMTASAETAFASVTNSSFMPNTNYLFDASGNLVRVHDSGYSIFTTGNALSATSTPSSSQFPTQQSPFTNAAISLGLGFTAAESYTFEGTASSGIGLRMGRWQSGSVNVTDLNDFNTAYLDPLGGRSVHWVVAQVPSAIPTTGQFHYTRLPGSTAGSLGFATAPTDAYGNVGVLDGARLNVDFANLTVNAGVRMHINSGPGGTLGEQSLGASASDVALSSGNFNVSSGDINPLRVSCIGTGCAPVSATAMPGYGGRITGSLSGLNVDGAFFRYTFNTNYATQADAAAAGRVKDDYINGMVGFQKGPEIKPEATTAATGPAQISTAYVWDLATPPSPGDTTPRPFIQTQSFGPLGGPSASTGQPGYTFTAGGNLSEVVDSSDFGSGDSIVVSGGTPANAQAPSFASTGITFGRYDNSVAAPVLVTSINSAGDVSDRSNLNSGFHWIKGPAQFPFYLSSALNVTGTAIYSKDAGVVVDQSGAAGTLSFAEMNVDFTKQTVDFFLSATTANGNWDASTPTPVRLDGDGGFFATTGSVGGTINGQTVTDVEASTNNKLAAFFTPTSGTPQSAQGSANGQLTGAGLNGAILSYALTTGTANSVAGTVAFAGETQNTLADYRGVLSATGMNSEGSSVEEMNYSVGGNIAAASRVSVDNKGALGKFDGYQPLVVAPSCTGCTPHVREVPATFLLTSAFGGGATVSNAGFDPTSGVRWGRYDGTINVIDRITGATSALSPSITLGPGGAHFIYSGTGSGPTVLPAITGTTAFSLAGGTNPTDNLGNAGTLNSAALSVDFTNQKIVNVSIDATVNSAAWNASASNIAIQSGAIFSAQKSLNGTGNLTVTRAGSATNTAGQIVGAFVGPTARGAMTSYSLYHNPNGSIANQTGASGIAGVAAFKR